jgi:hypothetical protein
VIIYHEKVSIHETNPTEKCYLCENICIDKISYLKKHRVDRRLYRNMIEECRNLVSVFLR